MIQLPSGVKIENGVRLAPFTSWMVGREASHFALPKTILELKEVVAFALIQSLPISILGGGTNVLVADQGVAGLTLGLRKLSGIESSVRKTESESTSDSRLHLECLAGTSKSELLKQFLKHRLQPALFLAGLPGDVGGGVAMNAGVGESVLPREFVELTEWVEVLRLESHAPIIPNDLSPLGIVAESLKTVRFGRDQLQWSYRHCEGWKPGIITRVGLSWPMSPVEDLLNQVKQANHTRLSKQPLDLPSCGSVFKNPTGHKAGQLIEECGLKGFSIGGAEVSKKHANFIVNRGGATAKDIDGVITHVQKTVLAQKSIQLTNEVVYLGDWS